MGSTPAPTQGGPRPGRGLVAELHETFRTLLAGLVLVAVLLGAMTAAMLGYVQPDLRHDTEVIRTLRVDHEAMLDRENGLRSWLATGDRSLLQLSDEGASVSEVSAERLLEMVGQDPAIDRTIFELQLASQAWTDRWAEPVARLDPADLDNAELVALFAEGREAFDVYRDAQDAATDLATSRRDDALIRLRQYLVVGFATVVSILLLVALMLRTQHHRLRRRLSAPVRALVEGMEAMQRHEATATELTRVDAPAELQLLATQLHDTSIRVREQHHALEAERAESEAAAVTLRSILAVAREIAGSLNVRYVAETVASAAATIVPCERAVVWLTSDGEDFVAVHDSSMVHGTAPTHNAVRIGTGAIGTVARDARPQLVDGSVCFPLVVGGRVMGVLEVVGSGPLDVVPMGSLETLATHAAAALEAARLHRATEELAQVDALTRLLNRRRLDDDLLAELERANRYGRPVGFVLLDLDRFKLLNDTFGHQHGDEVLRLTGECLAGAIRASDTVYRYGGEEFAVLVREGTRTATLELAERLRAELAQTFADREGFTPITASFGVALSPEHGVTAGELIQAADSALYAAKNLGRDRVVLASLGEDPMLTYASTSVVRTAGPA